MGSKIAQQRTVAAAAAAASVTTTLRARTTTQLNGLRYHKPSLRWCLRRKLQRLCHRRRWQ